MLLLSLTAAQPASEPDFVALLMVLALGILVAVMALRKRFGHKPAVIETVITPAPAAPVSQPTAPGAAGRLKLHDVDPKAAAMCMAIVADKLGKPLNELRFISIKEVK